MAKWLVVVPETARSGAGSITRLFESSSNKKLSFSLPGVCAQKRFPTALLQTRLLPVFRCAFVCNPDQGWSCGGAEKAHDRTTLGIVPNLCVLNLQREKDEKKNVKVHVNFLYRVLPNLEALSELRRLSPHCTCGDGLFLAGLSEISQLRNTCLPTQ